MQAQVSAPGRWLAVRPPRWLLLTLACVALFARGQFMLANRQALLRDPDGYAAVSWNIAADHTFSLSGHGIPTASRPPLYPFLLSLLDMLPWETDPFGYGLLQVVLSVATACLVYRLGQQWGLPQLGSLVAATLVCFDPILVAQSLQVMTETLAAFLATLALLTLTRAARDGASRWFALSGVVLGLCVLCRPTFLAWLVLVATVVSCRRPLGNSLKQAGAIVGAALVVLMPWAVRNQMVFGRPIITTTHGGFTLLLANNPEFYEYLREGAWGTVWDGAPIYEQFARQREFRNSKIDEMAADRWAYQQAWTNIRNEPLMFAYSCLVRVGRLWIIFPHQLGPVDPGVPLGMQLVLGTIALWYALELALAAVGAWILGRRMLATPWLWGTLLLASFTAVHALYWTDMRMRAPLVPVVALLAVEGGRLLAFKSRDRKPLQPAG